MRRVSVAEARQTLRELLDAVAAGGEVALLRRGKEIARLVPPPPARRRRPPSLAAFRRTIQIKGEPMSATVIRMRREARY
jgi:prevent-host-death family protein